MDNLSAASYCKDNRENGISPMIMILLLLCLCGGDNGIFGGCGGNGGCGGSGGCGLTGGMDGILPILLIVLLGGGGLF